MGAEQLSGGEAWRSLGWAIIITMIKITNGSDEKV